MCALHLRTTSWQQRTRRRRSTTAHPWADRTDIELRVSAERHRIASALHDDVGQLLFAIAARARRATEMHSEDVDQLRAALEQLQSQVNEASDRLRTVLRDSGPTSPAQAVPIVAQRDLDDFAGRTGMPAHLVVSGVPCPLPAAVERVALSCLRQALFNVQRHAGAHLVVVTLGYQPDRICLVVQDDGVGLPAGFEPRAVPAGGYHWGFTSMAEQVERLGGAVSLRRAEEGGTQLRVQLPLLS